MLSKIRNTLNSACWTSVVGLLLSQTSGWAQLNDPIPETVEVGSLVLELEDWLTMPATANVPRARISIFRALPDGRLFVNDLRGLLYEVTGANASVYLDLESEFADFIDSPGLGTGFQAFTFHPDFATNGKFYTVHSEPWNAQTPDFRGPTAPYNDGGLVSVLSEWTADDPSAASFSGTSRELFRVYFPTSVHGMQEIAFNPNAAVGSADYGMLYVCIGEGGSYLEGYADNEHRLDSPMGTIFRIDPAGNNSANGNYGIPSDNPWAQSSDDSVLGEIYAYGFRNPHRISWDIGGTGRGYIGDIGETQVEELNLLVAGADYGFPEREGTFVLDPDAPQNNDEVFPLPSNDAEFGYTYPVAQYDHDEGIAIVLGPVYRGDLAASFLDGYLFFGDIAWGRVFAVKESDLALGSQASFDEVRLELNGIAGELRSFVGSSRADLRWGQDADGEIYLMTKTDGKIRKVVGARRELVGAVASDPDRWILGEDFEDGLGAFAVQEAGTGGTFESVADPFGDASNHVLRVTAEDSRGTLPLTLTPNALSTLGSCYFRFALGDLSTEALFGFGRSAVPSSAGQTSVSYRVVENATIDAFDVRTPVPLAELNVATWYEVWALFNVEERTYDVYLRGGPLTAPTLLAGGLTFRQAAGDGLISFVLEVTNGSATSEFYLDDIYVDPAGHNIAAPVGASWLLVGNFEATEPLASWSLATSVDGVLGEADSAYVSVETEISGNRFLEVRAADGATGHTFVTRDLLSPLNVSDVATFYGRVRADNLALNQVFGLGTIADGGFLQASYSAFEASLRISGSSGLEGLSVRDGSAYLTTTADTLLFDRWYEFWMIVRNGGEASGGQTFDLYWREEWDPDAPARVVTDASFRSARETPLSVFGIIANNMSGAGGTLAFDDLLISPGVVLDRPVGTGSGMFPGAPGGKFIPWLGWIWDNVEPWVYHLEHRWLYFATPEYRASWAYDQELGWMLFSPDVYPWIYSAQRGWIYYLEGTVDSRWFFDQSDDAWFRP